MSVTYFDEVGVDDVPDLMPSPFGHVVHPLARRAADEVRATERGRSTGECEARAVLGASCEGKMFGVLVVQHAGRIGYLRAFSGMLGGTWHVDGFVGPAFDAVARAWWPAAEAELGVLASRIAEAEGDARRALVEERSAHSRVLLQRLYDTYVFANARGERRPLRELFAPGEPPGGAGDCAAPKLFAHAYREGLRPLALAEFWIGDPKDGRTDGVFYPACRGKCGPILAHVLEGLSVEPAPVFATRAGPDEPRVVFEDDWIVVVDKPCGMLSVPGRGAAMQDTAFTRLRKRYPEISLVHRLDLDTSGLLLAAKDVATYKALQAAFAQRRIDKRYIAWLDGVVAGERGTIELALRVDVDDRPRQIVDPIHGKRAITDWQILERTPSRTRVAFYPRTGRTHQLRVHAAIGLGAPITGDRLYGQTGERLLLHAESLAFAHPHTGARIELSRASPF